jgi:hypothetical protein
MEEYNQSEVKLRYQAAADSFIDKIKVDPNVIAVIISGSLAYDQVWEKSDIDMTLIVRDQVLKHDTYCVVEDDITINVYLVTRSNFKRFLESLNGGSMQHSYFSKGQIVYSTDDSLYEYFEDFKQIGKDDIAMTIFYHACELVHIYDKCLKWIKVKQDPLYAQFYLLKAAEVIARMEVCLQGEIPTREAITKAYQINPELIAIYYNQAMSHHYTKEEIMDAIERIEQYLQQHLDIIQKPVIDYMSDGEMKTVTMITKYFRTESHFIIGILDYLADKGVLVKISQTIRITPKSRMAVEEITYQYLGF